MRRLALFFLLAVLYGLGQTPEKRLGSVEFFGYDGVDIAALRRSFPVAAGEPFSHASIEGAKERIRGAVEKTIGRTPTDIAVVCRDDNVNWIIFVGLGATPSPAYRRDAIGSQRLPKELLRLDRELMQAWMRHVQKGAGSEDRSQGYALSNDPELRAKQMKLRTLALRMEAKIFAVLAGSSDGEQRAIAATALGYARHNQAQVQALIDAAADSNADVRNNSVRALGVLLEAHPLLRKTIPTRIFTDLVKSGLWSDRNKGSYVLLSLTKSRDPRLLSELQATAAEALREMAQWKSKGHAYAARMILGRMAGIEEAKLEAELAN